MVPTIIGPRRDCLEPIPVMGRPFQNETPAYFSFQSRSVAQDRPEHRKTNNSDASGAIQAFSRYYACKVCSAPCNHRMQSTFYGATSKHSSRFTLHLYVTGQSIFKLPGAPVRHSWAIRSIVLVGYA